MAKVILNLCPVEIDLCITRGDTTSWSYTILKKDGVTAEDITGFSFLLTVDPLENPPDGSGKLFTLTGTIPVGTDGVVVFGMSVSEADQTPNEYFNDLQMTDLALKIRTIVKGTFEFRQDITK